MFKAGIHSTWTLILSIKSGSYQKYGIMLCPFPGTQHSVQDCTLNAQVSSNPNIWILSLVDTIVCAFAAYGRWLSDAISFPQNQNVLQ